jgi:hypothetical protein
VLIVRVWPLSDADSVRVATTLALCLKITGKVRRTIQVWRFRVTIVTVRVCVCVCVFVLVCLLCMCLCLWVCLLCICLYVFE